MLRSINSMLGLKLRAEDGDFGQVRDLYFDDQSWAVRYAVAGTGTWLPGRQVLLSPHALGLPDSKEGVIPVALTKKQIEESPSIEEDKPVSRQMERDYFSYYQWPLYWHGPYLWGAGPVPVAGAPATPLAWDSPTLDDDADIHLRSTKAVAGHHLQASDGSIGHVEDYVLDDETWSIRYLVVDTRNWWPGKKVLLSPEWISRVSWADKTVFTELSRETVKSAPEFSGTLPLGRDYEDALFKHHGKDAYWTREEEILADYR